MPEYHLHLPEQDIDILYMINDLYLETQETEDVE